ncbi:uncharacterized protein ColSpa_05346 [Colletotrichum spaethianum]|uniref:Uncharacterized protein n=1 Tax=Colletotrichum spaethianum TaxID=700344 RepID=A0AA37LEN1_9PEZI|nr:uncharacterized protein ColSpa_05346 [Colletotrichum spaethianum]GKT45165.1 hypothetical protein ColSpa_05346 [Colletotrichum spaethianum]
MPAMDTKLANMRLFDNRHLLKVQIFQIIVIHIVMGLSGARLFLRAKGGPVTRNNTMSLAIAAKSMVFLVYELSTQHFSKFRRFASLKTNMILNCLEPLFWGAVAFLSIQGNIQRCVGVSCTLSWVIVGAAIFLKASHNSLIAAYVAVISYTDFRFMRRTGTTRGASVDRKAPRATEEIVSAGSVEEQELAPPVRKTERTSREQWTH